MAALLFAGELVFKVNAGCTSFNHHLDQLENIKRAAKAGFSVRNNRREPIDRALPFRMIDLVPTLQCLINALYDMWNAVRGVQTLIRIVVPGEVCVGRNLPATDVNRFQTGPDL